VKKGKPKDFCLETCNPTLCESPSTSPSKHPSESPSESPSVSPSESSSVAPSSTISASPSATPNDEVICEDNSIVQFKVPNNKGKKKNTKCNKIKEKDCKTKFTLKKKIDGAKKGKPKDFCLETCNPTLCCKDGTEKDYKIKNNEGIKVKGEFSCKKIKKKGYCTGKLKTGEKLKDVCKESCDQCT